jgi:phosphatidylglycerol:prolipoprotein diacylglycerol transferase
MILAIPPGWSTAIGWVVPYQLALLPALIAGAAVFLWQMRRLGVSWSRILSTLPLAVVITVACARVLDLVIYDPEYLTRSPFDLLKVLGGGLSSHGAFLGIAITAFVLARIYRRRAGEVADGLLFWGLLGTAAARVGDFFHAQGVGTPTGLPFAMSFEELPDGGTVARHPVHFYEIGFVAILVVAAAFLMRRFWRSRPGFAATLTLTIYLLGRLLLDVVRDVQVIAADSRFTVAHLLSLVAIAALVPALWISSRRGHSRTLEPPREPTTKSELDGARTIFSRFARPVLGIVAAGLLGGIAEMLIAHVRWGNCQIVAPCSMLLFLSIFWVIPVVLLGRLGTWLGAILTCRRKKGVRTVFRIVFLVFALGTALGGLVLLPMALSAVIVVCFALTLPAFHTVRDLTAYVAGGLGATAILGLRAAIFPSMGPFVTGPAVLMMFGIATVLAERVRSSG